ncbi:MAG: hypothetical protein U0599_25650 [Vicinamibacteria bacterium]
MSLNPNRSKQATIASLVRKARFAEARGRILETIDLLREVAELDPDDRRTLHHLGDIFRLRLNRMSDAATWYARAARALERDDLPIRAIAVWRIVLQCNPLDVEAHERIGALYVETNRLGDARVHWARSEQILQQAGLGRDAAILRAQREAIEPSLPEPAAVPEAGLEDALVGEALSRDPLAETTRIPSLSWLARPEAPPDAAPDPAADPDLAEHVAERVDTGRSYLHYGLHPDARRVFEEALALAPDHVEARELLAHVCRELNDTSAATYHLEVLGQIRRRHGSTAEAAIPSPTGDLDPAAMTIVLPMAAAAPALARVEPAPAAPAPAPVVEEPLVLPPFEEWGFLAGGGGAPPEEPKGDERSAAAIEPEAATAGEDLFADLMDDVGGDFERMVERARDDTGHE